MIRSIQPLENKSDFNKLTDLFFKCLDKEESFRFLSYSLIKFDKETVDNLTKNHRKEGIEYLIAEQDEIFQGVLAYKKDTQSGFELFVLAVDEEYQQSGIGQSLINESVKIAQADNYKSIDSFVFADNKKMLRLMIKNNFRPINIQYHARADGMDLLKLRKYL